MIYDTTTGVPEPLPDTPDAEFACLVVSAQNAYSPNTERAEVRFAHLRLLV